MYVISMKVKVFQAIEFNEHWKRALEGDWAKYTVTELGAEVTVTHPNGEKQVHAYHTGQEIYVFGNTVHLQ